MNSKTDDYKKGFDIIVEDEWIRIQAEPGQIVTADFILSMLKELYSMKAYQTEKIAGLWDFRGCTSNINYETMHKITSYIDIHYDPSWSHNITALVVDKDVLYGLARMYEVITEDIPTTVRIFKDIDEAQAWIREEIAKPKKQDD